MERVDCIVIGAGVVGLAVARRLALEGREVVVLEAEGAIGTHTSSRNSEVIHAGIYYTPGSLKARLCVAGKQALYRYCEAHGVGHRRCGKLIVATRPQQTPELARLRAQALANGVDDLQPLSAVDAGRLEPEVRCVAALFSPSTGIIDSHGFMLALQGEAEQRGAMIALKSRAAGGRITGCGIELDVCGEDTVTVSAGNVVNYAGLHAQRVAAGLAGFPPDRLPPCHYCKGNYFTLTGRSPFSHLVYPIPETAGLGVHVTLDLAGQARFGPDVEWTDAINYDVDPRRADAFYAAIRTYWPDLKDGALAPGYAGIRPKIQPEGEAARDFLIQGPADHGIAGLVNLFGIESPGLTAALALGEHVRGLLLP